MVVQRDYSLKKWNSFGINCFANYFTSFENVEDLKEILNQFIHEKEKLVLGSGSNILFTRNFSGLVLKNEIMGIEVLAHTNQTITLKVGAGENWHNLVLYCIKNNFAGIENLSLIPGNVGACPIQNIGAYGVEVKDVISKVQGYFIDNLEPFELDNESCQFGYRDSIFKQQLKNKVVITYVNFTLQKQPSYNISYGAIQQELDKMQITRLSIKAISDAVIAIRSSKLPNINEVGNAGSFFKNPEVNAEKYQFLKNKYISLVGYALPNGNYKLAAGWLIEFCGFKGYRIGDAGCYSKQALVLVNYGNATGQEIYNLSQTIIDKVHETFGIILEREVNII
jgi:UDP-N-acetylmuramate dehydrogenase